MFSLWKNWFEFFYRQNGSRRAVVFYLDKGTGFLSYLTWSFILWLLPHPNPATVSGLTYPSNPIMRTYSYIAVPPPFLMHVPMWHFQFVMLTSSWRWLLAWKEIGLNSEDEVMKTFLHIFLYLLNVLLIQEFDLILMTHPISVPLIPPECEPVPEDFDPGSYRGQGR